MSKCCIFAGQGAQVPGNEHVLPITAPELIDAAVDEMRSSVSAAGKFGGWGCPCPRTRFLL